MSALQYLLHTLFNTVPKTFESKYLAIFVDVEIFIATPKLADGIVAVALKVEVQL